MKTLNLVVLCFIGIGISQASNPVEAGTPTSKVQRLQSNAPKVICTVRMNFWCIVQADAGLNMVEAGDYRIWKMTAPGSQRAVVTIRENKSCDSPADLRPRKMYEKGERARSGDRRHTVGLAISADGICTLQVEYLSGNTDLALEAKQIAKYRLYLCEDQSCRRPLLDVK
jgi:hypothetical protein